MPLALVRSGPTPMASINNALGESALFQKYPRPLPTRPIGDVALANNDSSGSGLDHSYRAPSAPVRFLVTLMAIQTMPSVLTSSLGSNVDGLFNNVLGFDAMLVDNVSGSGNVAIGDSAGAGVEGDFNIYIGFFLFRRPSPVPHRDRKVKRSASATRLTTACFIGGISGVTASGGAAVFVNAKNGKLGTSTSSARFKDEIKPIGKASEAILALKPVSFRYKKEIDPQGIPQFGLVAEEVENVNPDLVPRDSEGKPYTVRYEQINAMLLNEFIKDTKKSRNSRQTLRS